MILLYQNLLKVNTFGSLLSHIVDQQKSHFLTK